LGAPGRREGEEGEDGGEDAVREEADKVGVLIVVAGGGDGRDWIR